MKTGQTEKKNTPKPLDQWEQMTSALAKEEVRISLFITPDPPALHRGGIQTTAQLTTLTQTFFFFFFTSVKWNSEDYLLVMLFLL